MNFLALVGGTSSGGFSGLEWYIHASTTNSSLLVLLSSSATSVSAFLLYLVWPNFLFCASRSHPSDVFAPCPWDPCQGMISCIPGECSQSHELSIIQPYVVSSLVEHPQDLAVCASLPLALHAGQVPKLLCGVFSFLPNRPWAQILFSHFSTSLPKLIEHLPFTLHSWTVL